MAKRGTKMKKFPPKYVAKPMTLKQKEELCKLISSRTVYVTRIEPVSICLRQDLTLSFKLKKEDLCYLSDFYET